MNRIEQLNQWLNNRQRKYADGVALFSALARAELKKKYGNYFAAASPGIGAFDPHFTQLVNVLSRLSRNIRQDSHLYPAAFEEVKEAPEAASDDEVKKEIESRNASIDTHREQISDLEGQLQELNNQLREATERNEDNNEDNRDSIGELEDRIDELNTEIAHHSDSIEQLKEEVAELSKPGVKVIKEDSLPKSIKKCHDRIKEIVPLIASLHSDLCNESLAEEQRKKIAEELCDLDDERRRLWDTIDDWSEGKGVTQLDAERPEYSDNKVVRGYQLARRIKRLKSNIATAEKAIEKARQDGKKTIMANAASRKMQYEKELEEIQQEIGHEQEAE